MIDDFTNGTVNPMELKKKVAKSIVRQYHSQEAADEAEAFFYKQVQQKGFDDKAFEPVKIADIFAGADDKTLLDVCAKLNAKESKSNLRRLIESGAVSVNGEKQSDAYAKITPTAGTKFKIGKRLFFELVD